jgi:hypothetical protein
VSRKIEECRKARTEEKVSEGCEEGSCLERTGGEDGLEVLLLARSVIEASRTSTIAAGLTRISFVMLLVSVEQLSCQYESRSAGLGGTSRGQVPGLRGNKYSINSDGTAPEILAPDSRIPRGKLHSLLSVIPFLIPIMASRTALSRLSTSISRSATANLSTSAASKLVSRNALASTPLARVSRSAPRFLVGEQRRMASSDEGRGSMVSPAADMARDIELTWARR